MEENSQLMEANKALLSLSEYYYHAFGAGPGEKVLQDLTQITHLSCLSPNRAMDFQAEISPEQLMFIREGQNQVIRHIKQMMSYYQENKNG